MIRQKIALRRFNPRHSKERWPIVVAALLTFGAGALDVVALTHLGGVFASVMTGNLALMGLGIARADAGSVMHSVVAVVFYVVGVAVGTRVAGAREPIAPAWPRSVTVTLGVELVVLCAMAIGWATSHGAPVGDLQLGLLAAAAASMGLQSAAMGSLGVTLATTYLTGTLTGLIADRTRSDRRQGDPAGLASLMAAVGGAACAGLVLAIAPTATPLLCVVPLAVVTGTAVCRRRSGTRATVDGAAQAQSDRSAGCR